MQAFLEKTGRKRVKTSWLKNMTKREGKTGRLFIAK